MLKSDYRRLCEVTLPYSGRQKYMHTMDLANPSMPDGFDDYVPIVTMLCAAAGAFSGEAHVTVDEKEIEPGNTQRRPGPHVDGCFIPKMNRWGGGGGGWLHYCNDIGASAIGRMPIIVAASVPGCRAWRGEFDARPKPDGDLSHVELGDGELLPANVGYLLSPDCIHESLPMTNRVLRTFLRIALPADFKFWEMEKA